MSAWIESLRPAVRDGTAGCCGHVLLTDLILHPPFQEASSSRPAIDRVSRYFRTGSMSILHLYL